MAGAVLESRETIGTTHNDTMDSQQNSEHHGTMSPMSTDTNAYSFLQAQLVPSGRPLAPAKTIPRTVGLKCPYGTCTHAGTFPRKYELNRHLRSRHFGDKPFCCPYSGCFNRKEVTAYARSDKLTSHIRNVHARHAKQRLNCCFYDCTKSAEPIDLLGIHIINAHSDRYGYIVDERARGLVAAASTAYRQCPLWRCTATLPLASFIGHLRTHTFDELYDYIHELRSEGYRIMQTPHALVSSSFELNATKEIERDISIHVLAECPLCSEFFESLDSLHNHIDELHVISEDQQEHYRLWKAHLQHSEKFKPGYRFASPWKVWNARKCIKKLVCPGCQYKERCYFGIEHQISMLADSKTLRPYRRAILKLYPDFATHPIVWRDLA